VTELDEMDAALERGKALSDPIQNKVRVTISVDRGDGTSVERKLVAFRDDETSVRDLTASIATDVGDMILRSKER
jgi:hypothetical protein